MAVPPGILPDVYEQLALLNAPRIQAIVALAKGVTKDVVGTPALDSGGKRLPKQGLTTGIAVPAAKCDCAKEASAEACKCDDVAKSFEVPILKSADDKQIVYGVVLQPETVDAQGDIYDANVIETAAHNFLAAYNSTTKLGFQHKEFKPGRFALVESYITTSDTAIGTRTVKAGSWIMAVKVLDKAVWKMIKDGEVKGFSIGGKAKVKKLKAPEVQGVK